MASKSTYSTLGERVTVYPDEDANAPPHRGR